MKAKKNVTLEECDWKYILRLLERDLGEQRKKALHYPERATMQLMAQYSINVVEQMMRTIKNQAGVVH